MKTMHYLLILDQSGSMGSLKEELLDAINDHILEIKLVSAAYKQKTVFSLCLFNEDYGYLYKKVGIEDFNCLTEEDYNPNGCTALFDAIGFNLLPYLAKKNEKLLCSIFTDGMENSSSTFDAKGIKGLIKALNKGKHWVRFFCSEGDEQGFQQQLKLGKKLKSISLDKEGLENFMICCRQNYVEMNELIEGNR